MWDRQGPASWSARAARWTSARSVGAVSVLVVLALASGCGGSSARQDLNQSLQDAETAVRTTELALDLLQRDRTTRAVAEVAAGDMVDQIGLAQRQLVKVRADTAELQDLRQQAQTVVAEALSVVQDTEDVLAEGGDLAAVGDDLLRAQRGLETTAAEVGER